MTNPDWECNWFLFFLLCRLQATVSQNADRITSWWYEWLEATTSLPLFRWHQTAGDSRFNCTHMITVTLTITGRGRCLVDQLLLTHTDHSNSRTGRAEHSHRQTKVKKKKKTLSSLSYLSLFCFIYFKCLFGLGFFSICKGSLLTIGSFPLNNSLAVWFCQHLNRIHV